MSERELRERMVEHGRSLFDRGLTSGSSGNISVRLPDGMLITPTNSCLGQLDPDQISRLDSSGSLLSGRPASKEVFLHAAYYRSRDTEQAIVHLHSTWSVAVSCLSDLDPENVMPPITGYFVIRVGRLPLVPYFAPGDLRLADAVEQAVKASRGALLANHGPVNGGRDCVSLSITQYDGGAEHYRKHGVAITDEVLQACLDADAVLLAAIGLPDVRKPDGTEVQPEMMMGLRRALGLYAAIRPVKLYPGVKSPLNTAEAGIDMVILRENLEGLFASFGGGCLLNDQVATDTIIITREGTERVVDYAFQLSQRRKGRPLDGKRRVTCVDKVNVFRSFAFFRKVFFEVAGRYPEIESDTAYVDAMSLYMVTSPSDWDVLVMENQFGDILSDLGAAIVGGLGLGPSAEIGDHHALFQPSHGTAPQLAGKNVANPIATILSAAMMLDWLGRRHDDDIACRAGAAIETAVSQLLKEGQCRTADQGGTTSTSDVATAVSERITQSKSIDHVPLAG